ISAVRSRGAAAKHREAPRVVLFFARSLPPLPHPRLSLGPLPLRRLRLLATPSLTRVPPHARAGGPQAVLPRRSAVRLFPFAILRASLPLVPRLTNPPDQSRDPSLPVPPRRVESPWSALVRR